MVAIKFLVLRRRPVIGRSSLADEEKSKKESNCPCHDDGHDAIYDAFEGRPFAFGKNAVVKEHEAELDETESGNLHQFDGP